MHGLSYQFPIACENAAKPFKWGKPGKLVPIHFPQYGCFFPLDFHPVIYLIKWEMHNFPQQFPIAWENIAKTHPVSPQVVYPQHYIFYLF